MKNECKLKELRSCRGFRVFAHFAHRVFLYIYISFCTSRAHTKKRRKIAVFANRSPFPPQQLKNPIKIAI